MTLRTAHRYAEATVAGAGYLVLVIALLGLSALTASGALRLLVLMWS